MRAGYLTALSSRALGHALMLRPATPSRFEPDRPQTGFIEVAESQDTTSLPGPRGEAHPDPARPPGTPPPGRRGYTETAENLPLLDPAENGEVLDLGRTRGEALLERESRPAFGVPDTRREPAAPTSSSARRRGTVPTAASHGAQEEGEEGEGSSRPADTARNVPGERRDRAGVSPAVVTVPGPDRLPEGTPAGRRPHTEVLAAVAAGEHPAARVSEPTIVVRIGRLDVRAVQAPVPPPAPRRPPPGPSLEEHLRARDRARGERR